MNLDCFTHPPTYWYEGHCPRTGVLLRLPRTVLAEQTARQLMQQLATDPQYTREGKMYGVLLVETASGEQQVLKAFSGLLNGRSQVEEWVPFISGHEQIALAETQTIAELDAIKQELITLKQIPERQQYESLAQEFELYLKQLALQHQQRQSERQNQRRILAEILSGEALSLAFKQLDDQSRKDGIERRRLKQQQNAILAPLKQIIAEADTRIRLLKQQRKALSHQLQKQMHAAYRLTNFAGESLALQALGAGTALPTGSGDCCAPKLLHYAAMHKLKPLAMAEFWWGTSSANGDKVQGEFYGACAERCQPLMGFLLSGLPQRELSRNHSLAILYQDDWLLAVNKPTGLLSVPGRYSNRQDSVLSRLQQFHDGLMPVHRLDQETSGVLLLARDVETYRHLSRQFQQRQVSKIYEAVLAGVIDKNAGVINLPLWGDPSDRPRQTVNWQQGKPSQTQFQVMAREGDFTRIEFMPLTGRTHQLRVHAAEGLGTPILGDRLYGCPTTERLHLHARELYFRHPQSGQQLPLQANTPF